MSATTTVTYSHKNLFAIGIGHVIIARFKSGGRVEIGAFLVDTFCLGVKNAFYTQGTRDDLDDILSKIVQNADDLEERSGAWGRKLVESAVQYAKNLGFSPHRDYKKAARVLGGTNAKDCQETFTFGRDGKPMFIPGQHQSEASCKLVISILTKKLGEDGFDYLLPVGGSDLFMMHMDDEDE